VFLYAGAMGPPQNLAHVIDGFVAADLGPSAHLVLMGPGVEHDALAERAAGLPTVHVLDPVPIAEANVLLQQATAGIVSLADTPLHRATFPSKVQVLCALGVPVLAVAPGDVGRFVTRHAMGVSTLDPSRRSVSEALQAIHDWSPQMLSSYRKQSREAFEQLFNKTSGGAAFTQILLALMPPS